MEPFSDIRVRRAMQMALDLETMNNDYFKGRAEWKPEGAIGLYSGVYHTPFEQWPAELQGYYSYDPEGAERLLDEAGYPRGDDGVRLTVPFDVWEGRDLGFFELQAAYWRDIGVKRRDQSHGGRDLRGVGAEWRRGGDDQPRVRLHYRRPGGHAPRGQLHRGHLEHPRMAAIRSWMG